MACLLRVIKCLYLSTVYVSLYMILMAKPGGKIPLGKPRQRWEDTIKTDLKDMGWECVDLIHLSPDRGKWQVMNILVP
jgi:hypothetical protein